MRGCTVVSDKYVSGVMDRRVEVRIHLPVHYDPLEVKQAVVRWWMGREFGLEFIRMRPEEQERLRQFLNMLTPLKPG